VIPASGVYPGLMKVLLALGAGAVLLAGPASADDDSYLNDLTAPRTVHPPVSNANLLIEGREVCFHVRKIGMTADAAKDALVNELTYRGVNSDYASAGTLVHFALQDLCP
jgi:hypothetical protein